MKVVYLAPGEKAVVKEIESILEGMQNVVGGLIEAAYYFDGPECLICNEEGKLNGLELNRGIYDENGELIDIVAGPCFICDCSGENFDSLDDERIEKYLKLFYYPEVFICINGKIMSIKLN